MLCGKCRKEDRVPGQRWGAECRRNYMRDYMRRRKTMRDAAIMAADARIAAENWKAFRTKPPVVPTGPLTIRKA